MAYDELWQGGVKLLQGTKAFALGTDAVLLGDFIELKGAEKMCDLGTGSGVIALSAAFNNPSLTVDGYELLHESVIAARENVKLNSLEARVKIIKADIRDFKSLGNAGAYDAVVSNPPYFPVGSGFSSLTEEARNAREERFCTLDDVCAAAGYFTRWGGRFAIVHRPERLSEVMNAMVKYGIEPKRLRFVKDTARSLPSLILVEGRRGGKSGLTVEPDLVLRNDDGTDSPEVRRIYRR